MNLKILLQVLAGLFLAIVTQFVVNVWGLELVWKLKKSIPNHVSQNGFYIFLVITLILIAVDKYGRSKQALVLSFVVWIYFFRIIGGINVYGYGYIFTRFLKLEQEDPVLIAQPQITDFLTLVFIVLAFYNWQKTAKYHQEILSKK